MRRVLCVCVGFLFAACGGGGSTTGGTAGDYSCVFASGDCGDYLGVSFRDVNRKNVERSGCEGNGGTFNDGQMCTTVGRIGSCLMDAGLPNERRNNYYAGTASTLESQCAGRGGTWSSG